MTSALYNRIDAIESFAADVAHELKNPLTSLRSAVETLPLAQQRRIARPAHRRSSSTTCSRLDRLISDISDASRLDAELARADAEPVDMARLLDAVVDDRQRAPARATTPRIALDGRAASAWPRTPSRPRPRQPARPGVQQLIDNARSFSPADGTVRRRAAARRRRDRGRRRRRRAGHPARTRSSASSSASTPTGRTRASARTPASACRSRARSSRRIAAASRPRTGSGRRATASRGGGAAAPPRRSLHPCGYRSADMPQGGRADDDQTRVIAPERMRSTPPASWSARPGS